MPPRTRRRSARLQASAAEKEKEQAEAVMEVEEEEEEEERQDENNQEDEIPSIQKIMVSRSLSRTLRMFRDNSDGSGDGSSGGGNENGVSLVHYYDGSAEDDLANPLAIALKTRAQYGHVIHEELIETSKDDEHDEQVEDETVLPWMKHTAEIIEKQMREKKAVVADRKRRRRDVRVDGSTRGGKEELAVMSLLAEDEAEKRTASSALALSGTGSAATRYGAMEKSLMLIEKRRRLEESMKPEWHAPWRLMRVISGHTGWVRAIAVDPSNEWFATGGNDRTIKVWDLASGTLKITLTGHIASVRGIAISERSPYMFTVGEDNTVKCWDLEQNKVIRSYHGHLSGVYCVDLHPTLDILMTGGRDASVRVWDIRTKTNIFTLTGHKDAVSSVCAQAAEPQVISGSMDKTIRLWDLAAGKTRATLTNHKKGVRALLVHPTENTFCSASADNIKKWKCPEGRFMQNFSGHDTIVNTICVNTDNVLVSGGNDGSMYLWDWKTGYNFQKLQSVPQPGSLDSEAGILAATFDYSGSRLITGEVDKSIKIWCEDERATPETHPVVWRPDAVSKRY